MSIPMFSGDMFTFSTRYLKFFASALRYLFSSTHYSNISNNDNDNYHENDNKGDDNNDNHNTN